MRRNTILSLTAALLLLCASIAAAEFVPTPEEEQIRACLDMYPVSALTGKAVLYKKPRGPIHEVKDPNGLRRFYSDRGLQRMLHKGLPLPVVKNTEDFFILSLPEAGKPARRHRVYKTSLRTIGFHFISLRRLAEWYKHHPEKLRSVLGMDLKGDDGSLSAAVDDWERRSTPLYILRLRPADDSPLVTIDVPDDQEAQVRIVSRQGDWFELELFYSYTYGGSAAPGICRLALHEKLFRGFWKAPRDVNGFPVLLPAMLPDPADWETIADEIGGERY